MEGGCFKVPPALLEEKAVDVFFTVPGNKIYLVAISPSFFTSSWDIDLEDKKFDRDVGLPKNARIREACAVVFHGGEPENALVQTGCRMPLSKKWNVWAGGAVTPEQLKICREEYRRRHPKNSKPV